MQWEEEIQRQEHLAAKVETLAAELTSYKEGEEGRWERKKKEHLSSAEVQTMLEEQTAKLLEHGFEGAIRQVKEGVPLDQLDIQRVMDELPDDAL